MVDTSCLEQDVDYSGSNVHMLEDVSTPEECQAKCVAYGEECRAFVHGAPDHPYAARECWLKGSHTDTESQLKLVSGLRRCPDGELGPHCEEEHVDYYGNDIRSVLEVDSVEGCVSECQVRYIP